MTIARAGNAEAQSRSRGIPPVASSRLSDALIALGGALGLAFLVGLATWPPGSRLQLFEFGHWLGPASDMLRGKVPYRDTFPIHGFLTDGGLDYLLFRAFGPRFADSVRLHQVLGTLFQPAIYLVAASVTRRPLLCLAWTPLAIALSPGLIFDRGVIPLLALAAFALAISSRPSPSRSRAFLAGALAVVGVFYALEFGTFVLMAELACVGLVRFTEQPGRPPILDIGGFLGGVALGVLAASAALALGGALGPFLKTSFVDLPLQIQEVWGLGFPGPVRLVRSWVGSAPPYVIPGVGPVGIGLAARLYLVPIAAAFAGIVLLRFLPVFCFPRFSRFSRVDFRDMDRTPGGGPGREEWARLFVLTAACLLGFRYVMARFHFEAGNALVGPTVLAAALLLIRLRPARSAGSVRLAGLAAIILGLAAFAFFGGLGFSRDLVVNASTVRSRLARCSDCVPFDGPRGGGIRVPAAEIEDLRAIAALVEKNASAGPLFDLSNRPGLYFFLDRLNPTRFYQVPMMERFQDEVIADLERNPPSCVLLAPGSPLDEPDGRPTKDRVPRVWSYVTEHFPRTIRAGENMLALPASVSEEESGHSSVTSCR